jgi:hypothetical protein
LAATAKMVRRNNSLPVPAKKRVYPQHLISLAVELLQSANVDWEEVKTIAATVAAIVTINFIILNRVVVLFYNWSIVLRPES